jgi:hypothetical protein
MYMNYLANTHAYAQSLYFYRKPRNNTVANTVADYAWDI